MMGIRAGTEGGPMVQHVDDLLDRAREAVARHAWDEAFELLTRADRDGKVDPETLPMLADAAYLTGHPETARDAWERVYAERVRSGDDEAAAGAALQVAGLLMDAELWAPFWAWIGRAEQLLPDEVTAAHGALAMLAAVALVNKGSVREGLESARKAIEIATRFDDLRTRTLGRLVEGRALLMLGHVEEGLAILDEVIVSGTSEGQDPFVVSAVYCTAICSWQAMCDYERADQWTEAMKRWVENQAAGAFNGRCRVHRAQVMRLRGSCREAESEMRAAREAMEPYSRGVELGWTIAELGQIRMRLGDLVGAEQAFMEAHELGWEPQPWLALLLLAQGDVRGAAESIDEALEHPSDAPSFESPPNTELRLAPLLSAQTEIAIAAGDLDRAREAASQLERVARRFGTKALLANAAVGRGSVQLADGDAQAARASFEEGMRLWQELRAPYETARTRMLLAAALRDAGREERALMELRSARSAFERLGARLDARRAAEEAGEEAEAAGSREERVFVFTDIVNSTSLAEAIGDDAWRHQLRWHNDTLSSLVAEHRGEVVETTGDGFFITFDSPRAAVECAVAIQRTLEQHRREHGFAPQVRIGIHRAEATREGGSWSGVGVHAAARIGALAGGEEILASLTTAEGLPHSLSEPRAAMLKGIADPVDVVSISWR